MAAGDWGATVAAGGGGLGVATAEELVATSFAGAATLEEFVLGTCPAGGAVVDWLTVAGFSEVTSSLAVGCDEGRAAATVVAAAGLLLLLGATVITVAAGNVALGTAVAAGVLVGGITEGLVGGGAATTAAAGGVALLTMLLSGTTELSFGLGELVWGVSVLIFSAELEI